MSTSTLPVAHVRQFSDSVIMLAEQKESKLLPHVTMKRVNADYAYFDRMAGIELIKKTTRHQETPIGEIEHSRRRVFVETYHRAVLIDKDDTDRMVIDVQGPYVQRLGSACGRLYDRVIVSALVGNAVSVDEDLAGSNVALPSAQIIEEDVGTANSNLNIDKLLRARRLMHEANVDVSPIMVVSPKMLEALLGTTAVQSADYNSIKALVNGELNSFCGFQFVRYNELPGTSIEADPTLAIAFSKDALGFAMSRDKEVKISERQDLSHSRQVYIATSAGAVRLEEEKVVAIQCVGG